MRLIVLAAFFGFCSLALWAAPLPPATAIRFISVAAAGIVCCWICSAILDYVWYGQRVGEGFRVIVRRVL